MLARQSLDLSSKSPSLPFHVNSLQVPKPKDLPLAYLINDTIVGLHVVGNLDRRNYTTSLSAGLECF